MYRRCGDAGLRRVYECMSGHATTVKMLPKTLNLYQVRYYYYYPIIIRKRTPVGTGETRRRGAADRLEANGSEDGW